MRCSKGTHIGKVRKNNEDQLGAWPDLGLFVVADGMGGHQAGEVASQIAVETLEQSFRQAKELPFWDPKYTLEKGISEANEKIYSKAKEHKEFRGMGTTITAAYLQGQEALIGHVGDSRAYRIEKEKITQLTEDHSLVNELVRLGGITEEEAITHPQKNVLTRALGVDRKLEIDFFNYQLETGDYLLLCTDGLSGLVTKEEIKDIVISSPSIEIAVNQLIDVALARGGKDNITLILVEVK